MKLRKLHFFYFSFLLVLANSAIAQTTITGTVKDAKGMPVAGASIVPKDAKKGTSTDTSGLFSIKTNPGGFLTITAVGFADTTISINYQRNIAVILQQKTNTLNEVVVSSPQNQANELSNDVINQQNIQNTLQDYAQSQQMGEGIKTYSYNEMKLINNKMVPVSEHVATTANMGSVNYGGMMPVYHQPTETKGSRYLLGNWSPGLVVNQFDTIIKNDSYSYNFDKITGDLLMTQDMKSQIEIDRSQVKSFALKSSEIGYVFVHAPLIDNGDRYFQLLGQGVKYAAYKSIKTKLVKANGVSTGLTSVGNDYDEYVDEIIYYFVDLKNKTVKQFELKKKSIKDVAPEKDKTEKYFADHKKDDINDRFVAGFVYYLNA
jgi:hypothetical protein